MTALTPVLREFLDSEPVGVLATQAADGRPRQSLLYFTREGDRLLISTLAARLKARDVRRTGWATLCVMGMSRRSHRRRSQGPLRSSPRASWRRLRRSPSGSRARRSRRS